MNEADGIRGAVTRVGLREFARRVGCSPGAVQRLVKRGVYPTRGPHGPAMRALVDSSMVGSSRAAPAEGAAEGLRLVPAAGWEGLPSKADRGAGDAGDEGESTEAANRRYAIARADLEVLRKREEARRQAVAAKQLIPADVFYGMAAAVGKETREMVERMARRVETYSPEARVALLEEWKATYPRIADRIAGIEPDGEFG